MQPPKLQSINKELSIAFYGNAPAWVEAAKNIRSSWLDELPYKVSRYMPGCYLSRFQDDNYDLPYAFYKGPDYNYDCYTGNPLVILEVTKDDTERGWMKPQSLESRPFCISEYVLKQYEHYFTYRRRNRETLAYENWSYYPYLEKYSNYDIDLIAYADKSSYKYTVVTKDDPEAGWAKPSVLKNVMQLPPKVIRPLRYINFHSDYEEHSLFRVVTLKNNVLCLYSDLSYYPYMEFDLKRMVYPWVCDQTTFRYFEVIKDNLDAGWAVAVGLNEEGYVD